MNPTNNPQQTFDQFVADTVKQQIAQQSGGNAPQQTQPEPIVLNVAGQQFSYENKAALEAALNNFVGAAGQRLTELQTQVETKPQGSGSYVQGDEPVQQFDNAEFVKHMSEDPREGLAYAFNKLLFDGKSENPIEDLRDAVHSSENNKRVMAALQFKENHPEFPGGQAAAKINEIRQQMNLPYDYNGLEAAYLVGMQRGVIPNFYALQAQQQAQVQQQVQQQPQEIPWGQPPQQQFNQGPQGPFDPRQFMPGQALGNPYLSAPPGVSRNNAYAPQANVDYENLTTEQIEAIFARAGRPIQGAR